MNAIVPLKEMIHGEGLGRQINRPLTKRDSTRSPYSNSYNNLFSEEEKEEDDGVVNAKEKSQMEMCYS